MFKYAKHLNNKSWIINTNDYHLRWAMLSKYWVLYYSRWSNNISVWILDKVLFRLAKPFCQLPASWHQSSCHTFWADILKMGKSLGWEVPQFPLLLAFLSRTPSSVHKKLMRWAEVWFSHGRGIITCLGRKKDGNHVDPGGHSEYFDGQNKWSISY